MLQFDDEIKCEKSFKKLLTKGFKCAIIAKPLAREFPEAPADGRGSIAQLGEHLPYKQGVTGSSPVVPTKPFNTAQ